MTVKVMQFCPDCGKEKEMELVEYETTKIIRGQEITYRAKEFCCPDHPEETFVNGQLIKENLIRGRDAYRLANGLLTHDQIVGLRNAYGLSQADLAKILDFGEVTITRYETKSVQDKAHDNVLRRCMEDPQWFHQEIENHRNIFSAKKYRQVSELSKNILADWLSGKQPASASEYPKMKARYSVHDIVNWFLNRSMKGVQEEEGGLTNLKLQKLLYYAQGAFMALKSAPLFSEDLLAWQHGPVVPEVYESYCENGRNPIIHNKEKDPKEIDSQTEEILEEVYDTLGKYDAVHLRNKTHNETPWLETRQNEPIEKVKIHSFFSANYDSIFEK